LNLNGDLLTMAEDYYQEDFENLSDAGADNNADRDSHKMRFSIDIHSIKEPTFRGLIYAKYGALPSLGLYYEYRIDLF